MSKWEIRNPRRRRGQPLTTTIPKSGSLFLLGPGRVPRTEGQISQNLRVRAVASFRDNGTTLMGENKQDTSKKGIKLIQACFFNVWPPSGANRFAEILSLAANSLSLAEKYLSLLRKSFNFRCKIIEFR